MMSNPRLLSLLIAILIGGIIASIRASFGAEGGVEGSWGIQRDGEAAIRCEGSPVMVLQDGKYFRMLANIGTSRGKRNHLIGSSTYRTDGDRLVVEPSFSSTGVEPKQIFLLQRSGGRALIRQGRDRVVFKPCPPVDPTNLPNW
jgi:hypothetical protein